MAIAKKETRVSKFGAKTTDIVITGNRFIGERANRFQHEVDVERERANGVLRYWFLFERDVVKAISTGNFKLLNLVNTRVEYLLKVFDQDQVERGILGEEEALGQINSFLHNSAWWAKVDNLNLREPGIASGVKEEEEAKFEEAILKFILDNKDLVHENTLKLLDIKDNEAIRMALNQIHYAAKKSKWEGKKRESNRKGVI